MKILKLKDLAWIFPLSLCLAAGLAIVQDGVSIASVARPSILIAMGLLALVAAWRRFGAEGKLAWMIALALLLRVGLGTGLYMALPVYGHNSADDRAGFVFTDAHRRDEQAWELASSGKPISAAFDRTYYTDQYGGLLALSALTYGTFSPDAHRPLLVLALAALVAALGVPFFFKAIAEIWGNELATLAGWSFVVYPESVLTGGAQMREPFLLTAIAVAMWAFGRLLSGYRGSAVVGFILAFSALIVLSPGVAAAAVVVLLGWYWFRGDHVSSRRLVMALALIALAVAVVFFASSVVEERAAQLGPLGSLLRWVRQSIRWVTYDLNRGSGQIQALFSQLGAETRFLFVLGYGVVQPPFPAALLAPTTALWQGIAIARSLGWSVILPLLLYAPLAAFRETGSHRRVLVWLIASAWLWILVAAVRAGGDQWDNPRYRLIFFGIQSLLAAYALLAWLRSRDAWLPRILLMELVCFLLFGQWYAARYLQVGVALPAIWMIMLGLGGVGLVLAGGAIWDRALRRS